MILRRLFVSRGETAPAAPSTSVNPSCKIAVARPDEDSSIEGSTMSVEVRARCTAGLPVSSSVSSFPPPLIKTPYVQNKKSHQQQEHHHQQHHHQQLKQEQRECIKANRPKKSVRFNEECNEYFTNKRSKIYSKHRHKMWYSAEEYEAIRDNLRRTILKAKHDMKHQQHEHEQEQQEQEDEQKLLPMQKDDENSHSSQAKGRRQRPPSSASLLYVKTLEDILKQVKEVNYVLHDASKLKVSENLALLYSSPKSRTTTTRTATSTATMPLVIIEYIGLETYLSAQVARECDHRKASLLEIVNDIQSEYRKGLWSQDEVGSELRDCCRQVTQTHTLMAQLLAKARWMASTVTSKTSTTDITTATTPLTRRCVPCCNGNFKDIGNAQIPQSF